MALLHVSQALSKLRHYIPNIVWSDASRVYRVNIDDNDRIKVFTMKSRCEVIPCTKTVAFAYSTKLPLELRFSDAIMTKLLTELEFLGIMLQTVSALVYLDNHCGFIHGNMSANYVVLSEFASVFNVNYDNITVLCCKWLATITNLSYASCVYARDNKPCYTEPSKLEECMSESFFNTNVRSLQNDIYRFLTSVGQVIYDLRTTIQANDPYSVTINRMEEILIAMLSMFLPTGQLRIGAVKTWPLNYVNVMCPKPQLHYQLCSKIRSLGYNTTMLCSPYYGNIHITSNKFGTLFAGNIRSLVLDRSHIDTHKLSGVFNHTTAPETTSGLQSKPTKEAIFRSLINVFEERSRFIPDTEVNYLLSYSACRRTSTERYLEWLENTTWEYPYSIECNDSEYQMFAENVNFGDIYLWPLIDSKSRFVSILDVLKA